MSESHTPGPLVVNGDGFIENTLSDRDLDHWAETYVSFSGHFGSYGPHLFATAPELLEALQLVVDKLGSDFELYREQRFAIDNARAVLAKATS